MLQPGGCGEKAGRKHTEMLNSGYFWELAICYLYEWPSSLFDECMTYGASSFILSVESSSGKVLIPFPFVLLFKISSWHQCVSSGSKIPPQANGRTSYNLLSSYYRHCSLYCIFLPYIGLLKNSNSSFHIFLVS